MNAEQIKRNVEVWILEEDLPMRAGLKVLKGFDPYEGMDENEIEAYWDFINWYLSQEHLALTSIPKQESDFWTVELDELGDNVSAFNTHDFERLHPFNKYHYKLKKIYEKMKDLAITHSCISNEEGRKNTRQRFVNLVEKEFSDEGKMLLDTYKRYPQWVNKYKLFERIEEINSKVRKCKSIWRKYANWE